MNVRYWLAKRKPAEVVAVDEEGAEHRITVEDHAHKWAQVERALHDLRAVKCIAYDAKGKVIATCPLTPPPDEDDPDTFDGDPTPSGARATTVINDPVASAIVEALTRIVPMVTQSNDKAVERHAEAYRLAFDEMRGLVKTVAERLNAMERAWHLMNMRIARNRVASEGGSDAEEEKFTDNLMQDVLGRVIDNAMGSSGGGRAPSNGAGRHDEQEEETPK